MNSVASCTAISRSSSGPWAPEYAAEIVDQVGRDSAASRRPALGHEVDEVPVQFGVRRATRIADPGDVGVARHERVDPADEQLGILDREPELQRRHLRRHR